MELEVVAKALKELGIQLVSRFTKVWSKQATKVLRWVAYKRS